VKKSEQDNDRDWHPKQPKKNRTAHNTSFHISLTINRAATLILPGSIAETSSLCCSETRGESAEQ
jgi:hypothetical protein